MQNYLWRKRTRRCESGSLKLQNETKWIVTRFSFHQVTTNLNYRQLFTQLQLFAVNRLNWRNKIHCIRCNESLVLQSSGSQPIFLGVRENNIDNGRKHEKKELKIKRVILLYNLISWRECWLLGSSERGVSNSAIKR